MELLYEAARALQETRYSDAQRLAEAAVQGAEKYGNPELLVRALLEEQTALRMTGDFGAVMVRSTRILAMAEDPATRHAFSHRPLARAVLQSYADWISSARMDSRSDLRQLLTLLDVADRWLVSTGHSDWRSSVLLLRAIIFSRLCNEETAINFAQDALVAYSKSSPGYTLASHHAVLGRLLVQGGRCHEAMPHFQEILDSSASDASARVNAYIGLTYSAISAGQAQEANRNAELAVSLAEGCSEDETSFAIDGLVRARREAGDLNGARSAAIREFELAQRLGRYRLYYATKSMVDVALDGGDFKTAFSLIEDLYEHATALDTSQGTSKFSRGVDQRRRTADRVSTEGLADTGVSRSRTQSGSDPADQNSDLEYADEQLSQQDIDTDHGGFSHYVLRNRSEQKVLVALCGWKWLPQRFSEAGDDLSDLPVCPKCKAEYDTLPP